MGACAVGVRAEELKGLPIGSWRGWRDNSAGPCATCRASWNTLAGAERIWVGGSGKANAVTVGATFGVLVGDR